MTARSATVQDGISVMDLIDDGIFDDEMVSATDLARHSSQILSRAAERPITITHKSGASCVLLSRERARMYVERARYGDLVIHAFRTVQRLRENEPVHPDDYFAWLSVFDEEDRTQFLKDLDEAYSMARRKGDYSELRALLHEWEETAWAISSKDVARAFEAEPDPVRISPHESNEANDL